MRQKTNNVDPVRDGTQNQYAQGQYNQLSNQNQDIALMDQLGPQDGSSSIYHVPSFLVKLYEIVDVMKTEHIVGWTQPDGESFIIKNPNLFSEEILPQYFKHNNFSSFIRQLNMYDFHKSKRKGSNDQIFKHPFFLKGKRHLLPQIKRKSNSSHPLKVLKQQFKSAQEQGIIQGDQNTQSKLTTKRIQKIMEKQHSNVKNQSVTQEVFNSLQTLNGKRVASMRHSDQNLHDLQQNLKQPKQSSMTLDQTNPANQQSRFEQSNSQQQKSGNNIILNKLNELNRISQQQNNQNFNQQLISEHQSRIMMTQDMLKNPQNTALEGLNGQNNHNILEQFGQANANKPLGEQNKRGSFFTLKDPILKMQNTKEKVDGDLSQQASKFESNLDHSNEDQSAKNDKAIIKRTAKYSAPHMMENATIEHREHSAFEYKHGQIDAKSNLSPANMKRKNTSEIDGMISPNLPHDSSIDKNILDKNIDNHLKKLQQNIHEKDQMQESVGFSFQLKNQTDHMDSPEFEQVKQSFGNKNETVFKKSHFNQGKDPKIPSPEFLRDSSSGTTNGHQVTSTRDQVKMMNKEAIQFGKTLKHINERFSQFEFKLKDMDQEQQRQRKINEHLLSQLIKSKEKEQMFEKVMTLTLQFFTNKTPGIQMPGQPQQLGGIKPTQNFARSPTGLKNQIQQAGNNNQLLQQFIQLNNQGGPYANKNMNQQKQILQLQNQISQIDQEISAPKLLQQFKPQGSQGADLSDTLMMLFNKQKQGHKMTYQEQEIINQFTSMGFLPPQNIKTPTSNNQQLIQSQLLNQMQGGSQMGMIPRQQKSPGGNQSQLLNFTQSMSNPDTRRASFIKPQEKMDDDIINLKNNDKYSESVSIPRSKEHGTDDNQSKTPKTMRINLEVDETDYSKHKINQHFEACEMLENEQQQHQEKDQQGKKVVAGSEATTQIELQKATSSSNQADVLAQMNSLSATLKNGTSAFDNSNVKKQLNSSSNNLLTDQGGGRSFNQTQVSPLLQPTQNGPKNKMLQQSSTQISQYLNVANGQEYSDQARRTSIYGLGGPQLQLGQNQSSNTMIARRVLSSNSVAKSAIGVNQNGLKFNQQVKTISRQNPMSLMVQEGATNGGNFILNNNQYQSLGLNIPPEQQLFQKLAVQQQNQSMTSQKVGYNHPQSGSTTSQALLSQLMNQQNQGVGQYDLSTLLQTHELQQQNLQGQNSMNGLDNMQMSGFSMGNAQSTANIGGMDLPQAPLPPATINTELYQQQQQQQNTPNQQ